MPGRPEWPCWECRTVKPRDEFPLGRSGKRRSAVCWGCTEARAHALDAVKMAWRTTWIDPETLRPIRRCADCREWKDLETGFYCNYRATLGSRFKVGSYCKPCFEKRARAAERANTERLEHKRALKRASGARYRERHPDRVRARNVKNWQRVLADPIRHAKVLEDNRINRALRNERAGLPHRQRQMPAKISQPDRTPRLPARPLLALVQKLIEQRQAEVGGVRAGSNSTLGHSIHEVCAELGVNSRTVRRWSTKGGTVQFDVAERVLMACDRAWTDVWMADEFPEVYCGLLADEPTRVEA